MLAEDVPWPAARAFWQARMERIANQIARDEVRRLQAGRPLVVEATHSLPVPGLDLKLTAKPDRIDQLGEGAAAHVYDYSSSKPPSDKEMEHFDKQLLLEAAMVEKGAFPSLGPLGVDGVSYIQLGGRGSDLCAQILGRGRRGKPGRNSSCWRGIICATVAGFTARRALQKAGDVSDYDHLSRWPNGGRGMRP